LELGGSGTAPSGLKQDDAPLVQDQEQVVSTEMFTNAVCVREQERQITGKENG